MRPSSAPGPQARANSVHGTGRSLTRPGSRAAFTGPADPPAYAPLDTGPEYVAVLRSLLGG
ncbi:hypothetical protein ACIO13_22770 [Streptomyces sp. NPDC087425]|uniref:hypothetical protein n=1 Tax=Streptomyces sp. NPDC087425 TaxID=3365787 RepID=UPI00382D03E9